MWKHQEEEENLKTQYVISAAGGLSIKTKDGSSEGSWELLSSK